MQSVALITSVFVRRSSHLAEMGRRSRNTHLPAAPEALVREDVRLMALGVRKLHLMRLPVASAGVF